MGGVEASQRPLFALEERSGGELYLGEPAVGHLLVQMHPSGQDRGLPIPIHTVEDQGYVYNCTDTRKKRDLVPPTDRPRGAHWTAAAAQRSAANPRVAAPPCLHASMRSCPRIWTGLYCN